MISVPTKNSILVPDTANSDSPWADPKVGEAAHYAIDRDGIAKVFGHGGPPLYQLPLRFTVAFDSKPAPKHKYNPEYYAGGIEWINTTLRQSWLRTPEFTKALTEAQSSRLPDVDKIRTATNQITDNNLLIPFCEYPTAAAFRTYVMNTGFFERGTEIQWNSEAAWLNITTS